MNVFRMLGFGFAAAGLLVLHTGCATASKPEAMKVAAPVGIEHKSASTVSVAVTGGRETNPAWTSQISDADFAAAIKSSIEQSGVFAGVVEVGGSAYHLEVMMVRIAQPMFGLSMTVTLEVNWTLSRVEDKAAVWKKAVVSTHTVGAGEAFVGTTRLRMANEGAARKNIEQALQEISRLDLP